MTTNQFLAQTKPFRPELPPSEVLGLISYQHNGKQGWGESDDLNWRFRESVAELLYRDYNSEDRILIKYLLEQEILYCREEGMSTENLRRLTFMLYKLGELTDIPLLFEAKFDTSFDSSCALDIDLVYGLDVEATKQYFKSNPHENYNIILTIEEYEKFEHHLPNSAKFIEDMEAYYKE